MSDDSKKNTLKKASLVVATRLENHLKDNPDALNKIQEAWREHNQMSFQLKALEKQNDKEIRLMTMKYEQTREILQMVFGERQTALNAHYAALDDALKSDDREIILASLRGISSIVSQNPLESFSEFCKVWDNKDETLYLDF